MSNLTRFWFWTKASRFSSVPLQKPGRTLKTSDMLHFPVKPPRTTSLDALTRMNVDLRLDVAPTTHRLPRKHSVMHSSSLPALPTIWTNSKSTNFEWRPRRPIRRPSVLLWKRTKRRAFLARALILEASPAKFGLSLSANFSKGSRTNSSSIPACLSHSYVES